MATRVTAKDAKPPLAIALSAPGMTPLLRAGLGGLAATVRALLLEEDPRRTWPSPLSIGKGTITVEPRAIVIDWGAAPPAATLEPLFAKAFRIHQRDAVIELPGAWGGDRPWDLGVATVLQAGLKRTFLQHGKSTAKSKAAAVKTIEIDDHRVPLLYQPYDGFAHQRAHEVVVKSLGGVSTELAGWAYPGATQRHVPFAETKAEYTAAEALCGLFAVAGCLSVPVAGSSQGVLVIVEPSNLVEFARTRPRLTPKDVASGHVAGPGDAALAAHLEIKLDAEIRGRAGVAAAHSVLLETLPWAKQQKGRSATITVGQVPDAVLDLYHEVTQKLPMRVVLLQPKDESKTTTKRAKKVTKKTVAAKKPSADQERSGFFVARSALRAFVTENIASGRRWFHRFATATVEESGVTKYVHRYRDNDGGLGALRHEEREGLIAMVEHLDSAEAALVRSVHVAMKQRFGAIAEESRDAPATMTNRWDRERERWRLAFSGAKTGEQIRAALADLWSRAGPNRELQASWEAVVPLLRPAHWELTRDLALVALASYRGDGGRSSPADDTKGE